MGQVLKNLPRNTRVVVEKWHIFMAHGADTNKNSRNKCIEVHLGTRIASHRMRIFQLFTVF